MTERAVDYSYLPELLGDIAEVVGLDAALKIARVRGGTSTHFPARVKPGHWLAEAIGLDLAQKLCREFRVGSAGIELMVPLGPEGSMEKIRRKADRMIADGGTNSETARATGMTTRTIERRRARQRNRSDADQEEMF